MLDKLVALRTDLVKMSDFLYGAIQMMRNGVQDSDLRRTIGIHLSNSPESKMFPEQLERAKDIMSSVCGGDLTPEEGVSQIQEIQDDLQEVLRHITPVRELDEAT